MADFSDISFLDNSMNIYFILILKYVLSSLDTQLSIDISYSRFIYEIKNSERGAIIAPPWYLKEGQIGWY